MAQETVANDLHHLGCEGSKALHLPDFESSTLRPGEQSERRGRGTCWFFATVDGPKVGQPVDMVFPKLSKDITKNEKHPTSIHK